MHLSQHILYVDLISALIKSTSRSTLLNWQLHAWQESPWAEVPAGESTSRMVANGRIESVVTTADWFAFLGMLSHKSLLFISTGLLPVGVDWFLPIQYCVYCTILYTCTAKQENIMLSYMYILSVPCTLSILTVQCTCIHKRPCIIQQYPVCSIPATQLGNATVVLM